MDDVIYIYFKYIKIFLILIEMKWKKPQTAVTKQISIDNPFNNSQFCTQINKSEVSLKLKHYNYFENIQKLTITHKNTFHFIEYNPFENNGWISVMNIVMFKSPPFLPRIYKYTQINTLIMAKNYQNNIWNIFYTFKSTD